MSCQLLEENQPTEQQQQAQLNQLQLSITLSNHEMHILVSNQDLFVDKITEYNNIAKQKINMKIQFSISEALLYLNEAEKILQYAAGCGKNINRELIVCILHNQACVYQILWELQHCANYLQALIYNYERFMKQSSQFSYPPSYINNGGSKLKGGSIIKYQTQKMFGFAGGSEISYLSKLKQPSSVHKMELRLINYYFQHCAVCSQLQHNTKALQSAKQAIRVLKSSFIERKGILIQEMMGIKGYRKYKEQEIKMMYRLLLRLGELINGQLEQKQQQIKGMDFIEVASLSIKLWRQTKRLNAKSEVGEIGDDRIRERMRELPIGSLMEILPKEFNKITNQSYSDEENQSIFNLSEFIVRVFFYSVAYFSVATELRILSKPKNKLHTAQNNSNEHILQLHKKSKTFHLIAILIATVFIPYECKYIDDILKSYSRHYMNNFQEYYQEHQDGYKDLLSKILQILQVKQQYFQPQPINKDWDVKINEQKQRANINVNAKDKQIKNNNKQSNELKKQAMYKADNIQAINKAGNIQAIKKSKKFRNSSKYEKVKRSLSKQSIDIKNNIQMKYNELQRILSTGNLQDKKKIIMNDENIKSKTLLKSSKTEKQNAQSKNQLSKDHQFQNSIKQTQKGYQNQRNIQHQKDPNYNKVKPQSNKIKAKQTKTKKPTIKKKENTQKPNLSSQEDEQFFFYMTRKTTKTKNHPVFSPKLSNKSIGGSRKSQQKKSVLSSRSNSRSSSKLMSNAFSPIISNSNSKGFLNTKKSQKKI